MRKLFFVSLIGMLFSSILFAQPASLKMADAVLRNDYDKVKELLDSGINPSIKTSAKVSVLQMAIQNNCYEIAKLLVEKGADVNATDAYKCSVLHFAYKLPMARLLLENGAKIDALYMNMTVPEFFAEKFPYTSESRKAKQLSELKKMNLPKPSYDHAVKVSKSQWLTKQEILDMVKLYDEFGYDFSKLRGRKEKVNALFIAALADNYEYIQGVIDLEKYDFNFYCPPYKQTILGILTNASTEGRTVAEYDAIVSSLVSHKVEIDKMSFLGSEMKSPLMIASDLDNLNRSNVLMKYGASVTITNEKGRTALFFAKSLPVMKALEAKGGDLLAKDKWDQTLLFGKEDTALLSYLLSKGVKINDVDDEGKNALFSVRKPAALIFLLSKGANINQLTNDGESIMEVDVQYMHSAMLHDNDLTDEYIEKFKILLKNNIKKESAQKAYDFLKNASFDDTNVMKVIEPYLK